MVRVCVIIPYDFIVFFNILANLRAFGMQQIVIDILGIIIYMLMSTYKSFA